MIDEIVKIQVEPLTLGHEPHLYALIEVVHEAQFEKKELSKDWLIDQWTSSHGVEAVD